MRVARVAETRNVLITLDYGIGIRDAVYLVMMMSSREGTMERITVRVDEIDEYGVAFYRWACSCGVQSKGLDSNRKGAVKGARTHATRSHGSYAGEVVVPTQNQPFIEYR